MSTREQKKIGSGFESKTEPSETLSDTGGLYCEDCDVADLASEDAPRYFHVAPWAVNEESAMRLWDITENMLA